MGHYLRADNDRAFVRLLGSGRQWQDDANCYAHVLHCEFMGTSRNTVEVDLRRRMWEAYHRDRLLLSGRDRGTASTVSHWTVADLRKRGLSGLADEGKI
jgi:hypothetical protein